MKQKILRVPAEVAEALEVTAAVAGVPQSIVIEAAFVNFATMDLEWRRRLVWAWWHEGKGETVELQEPPRQRGWRAMVRRGIARVRRWFGGPGGPEAGAP